MRALAGLLVGLWALCARADTLGLHLGTAHAAGGYQPFNPGVYYRHASGATLGAYRNSEGNQSAYAAWTWGDRLALTAGIVTGYAKGATLLLVPSVRVDLGDRLGARITLLAPPKDRPAVHFSLEWRL